MDDFRSAVNMVRPALIVLAVLALAPAARAADAAACERAAAETVTVLQMLEHPKHFEGRCVRLSGTVAGREIVDDVPSLYAYMTGRATNPDPHYVALYSADRSLADRLWSMRANTDVVGLASTCTAMYERAQAQADEENAQAEKSGSGRETIIMMSGPCHYRSGPAIEVVDAVPTGGKTRLTGDAALAKYGDAFELRSPRGSVRAPLEALFKAVRSGNAAPVSGKIRDDWKDLAKDSLLDPVNSPYAFLLGKAHAPQVRYFDIHTRLDSLTPDIVGVACICKQDDCTNDWPIAFGDMDAQDVPYKCARITRDGHVDGY